MTGRIVYEPSAEGRHTCPVRPSGVLPLDIDYARGAPGTVWECDCGRTFVAQEWRSGEMFPRWQREGRFARWRRERRDSRTVGGYPSSSRLASDLAPPPRSDRSDDVIKRGGKRPAEAEADFVDVMPSWVEDTT